MKLEFLFTLMLGLAMINASYAQHYLQSEEVNFSEPKLSISSTIFKTQAIIKTLKAVESEVIRYSFDKDEVTKDSPVLSDSLVVNESRRINFKSFHPDFKASHTVAHSFLKMMDLPRGTVVEVNIAPNEAYASSGKIALIDGKSGTKNFRDKEWLGFNEAEVLEVTLDFIKAIKPSRVKLSSLRNHKSWIFEPASVEVYSGENLIGSQDINPVEDFQESGLSFIEIELEEVTLDKMTIKIFNVEMPCWHPGKGQLPWLFFDEIYVDY